MDDVVSNNKMPASPLCVFCLSPPFTIRTFTRPPEKSTSRRLSVRVWRRRGSSQSSVRPRFKPFKRRTSHFLSKHIQETLHNYKGKTLSLEEVLTEIQKAWRPVQPLNSFTFIDMGEKSGKSSEMVSPILLRRRLSAPETIMRKHALRSDSQDSDSSHSSDSKNSHLNLGSDTSLNKKRDSDSMRRSTLLKRFLNKPLSNSRFSGSFTEWQRSFGRSLSINSSPEHLIKAHSKRSLNDDFKYSPQHKAALKLSPKHILNDNSSKSSSKTRIAVYNGNFETYSNTFSENMSTTDVDTSRCTNTSYTTFSDNSDSAYTNSRFSAFSNNNSSISEIQKDIVVETDASNQEINSINLSNSALSKYSNEAHESSTQTPKTTNVNVISNVQLSQSTLDLIFNHVMQDVNNKPISDVKITQVNNPSKIVQVQNIPSFYLKCKEEKTENKAKSMISNVGIGSPYSNKSPDQSQNVVPRFSALPVTTSMEVNISSGDSDKESDTVSLVDSLEDQSNMQEKIKSDVSLELPDNSDKKPTPCKPTSFFIPIEVDQPLDSKAVSELLPDKVKNRLLKRQQKREEKQARFKQNSFRSDSNYLTASEKYENNSDANLNTSTPLSDCRLSKPRENKLHLPSIETLRKIKIDRNKIENKTEHKINKGFKRKTILKDNLPDSFSSKSKTHWIPKAKNKSEKLSPLCTTKNEYVYDCGPRRIYHKTEFNNSNKRIEILEIVECVDTPPKSQSKKSKIPVLINQKLPKVKSKIKKPTFLDLNSDLNEAKLDQLIANILIETLNIPEMENSLNDNNVISENKVKPPTPVYKQQFEAIPEELSMQSSVSIEDTSNNNNLSGNNNNNNKKISSPSASLENPGESNENYKGKAAVAVVKDENFSSIPKGWITFYMLHKNRGSPDSTSDEGKGLMDDNKLTVNKTSDKHSDGTKPNFNENKLDTENPKQCKNSDLITSFLNNGAKSEKFDRIETLSSSSENPKRSVFFPTNSTGRFRKHSLRKGRQKSTNNDLEKFRQFGEWSVTVSGTSNCGHPAPDLEMCLKFPDSKKNCLCPSQSDSGLGEDNEKIHFPQIHPKYRTYKNEQERNENCLRQRLPEIDQSKISRKQRRSESSVPSVGSLISSRIEPRQTRTSTKRYNLTRPRLDYSNNNNHNLDLSNSAISVFNERHYAEILKRFPEILSITGNAINSDKK